MDIISIGIETDLSMAYQKAILAHKGTISLAEARALARPRGKEPRDYDTSFLESPGCVSQA